MLSRLAHGRLAAEAAPAALAASGCGVRVGGLQHGTHQQHTDRRYHEETDKDAIYKDAYK